MERELRRYIEIEKGMKERLMSAFGCSGKMVYDSLTYRSDTELARKIRYVAVKEYGGIPMRHCPECETMFTTEIGGKEYMRQKFSNGAELLWQKGTPEVRVRFRGKEEVIVCDSLVRLSELQLYAESL